MKGIVKLCKRLKHAWYLRKNRKKLSTKPEPENSKSKMKKVP
jgi:hypothetical protein